MRCAQKGSALIAFGERTAFLDKSNPEQDEIETGTAQSTVQYVFVRWRVCRGLINLVGYRRWCRRRSNWVLSGGQSDRNDNSTMHKEWVY